MRQTLNHQFFHLLTITLFYRILHLDTKITKTKMVFRMYFHYGGISTQLIPENELFNFSLFKHDQTYVTLCTIFMCHSYNKIKRFYYFHCNFVAALEGLRNTF